MQRWKSLCIPSRSMVQRNPLYYRNNLERPPSIHDYVIYVRPICWYNRFGVIFSCPVFSTALKVTCVESFETVKLLLKDVFCRKMLKIEEDWGDAGVVDDRFCHPCVSPRPLDPWLSLFEVKHPAAPQRSGQEGHLVTRTTLPRVICHHFAFPTIFTQAACVCVCVCVFPGHS